MMDFLTYIRQQRNSVIGTLLLTVYPFLGNSQDLRFDKFVIEDGLSSVNAILIDFYGFKWFGGTHGLYRYDGYEFKIFAHDPDDERSLSFNDIMTLYEDSQRNIWIGTSNNGVNFFERKTESIIRISGAAELSLSSVTSFQEDAHGNIWVGTLENGIFVLSRDRQVRARFTNNILDQSSLSNNDVFDIMRDSLGNLWVVTNSGTLDLFHTEDSAFSQYRFYNRELTGVRSGQKLLEIDNQRIWVGTEGHGIFEFNTTQQSFKRFESRNNNSINYNIITGLAKDSKNNVWISTDGGGLNRFNLASENLAHFKHDPNVEFSISNNASYSLLVDATDRVWLGMGDGKVNISRNSPFKFIRSGDGLSFNVVVDLTIDRKNRLWVATGGRGIDVIDLASKRKIFNINSLSESLLKTDIILCTFEDNGSDIWTGTFMGGVNRIGITGKIKTNYSHRVEENSLSNDHIFDIVEDHEGFIWIATQGGGLNRLDPVSSKFTLFNTNNNSGLASDRIQSLMVDQGNRLWVGHYSGGVQILNENTSKFEQIQLPGLPKNELEKYPIHALYEDQSGNILIASGGMGLIVVHNTFQDVSIYNESSGMPSNAVYGVLEANEQYWASTNMGIGRIDLASKEVTVLDNRDGLLTNDFESGAIDLSGSGELYFGSKEGIVYFEPEEIRQDTSEISVILTDLAVYNQPVKPGEIIEGELILGETLLYSDQINLPFSQNNFSLSFASPLYKNPDKLTYRYRLGGLDDRWIMAKPDRRFVNYANIDFGKYLLTVQASADGGKTWSGNKTIRINIKPPYYHTAYAYFLYLLLMIICSYTVYIFIRSRVELRNQLKFEKFSREKDNELNREKINFFTAISHEIRTPLTLILGHLEKLTHFESASQQLRHELSIIRKNGNRLLILINQLLDFRKMESGQMKLKVACYDVTYIIEEILPPFRELAIQKDIGLDFRNELLNSTLFIDASKLEIILYNLLSNALKFTTTGGKIEISASNSENELLLTVNDTGHGIAEQNLEKIFRPFFQGSAGSKYGVTGTGIGLTLVKDMVELHKGVIRVDSEEGKGTKFEVALPARREDYDESELFEIKEESVEIVSSKQPVTAGSGGSSHDLKLLVVEDNAEILNFLKESFQDQYHVLTATNGRDGLKQALEAIPDVIISDVMMPEMDGMEMCRHLKRDIRTNHIPVILLTARTGFIHEHSGLETGADDYITKPFKFDLLSIRTHNLIENRKYIHQKFKNEFLMEPKKIEVRDPQEKFISDLMDLIEDNISNAEYTVKDLAVDMGLSHSVLYRKIHALTNLSINDFIKSVRLKRASQLLKSGAYSISEVGFMVGFSNPKYFSTCFRAEFGKSPSEFLKEPIAE